MKEGDKVRLRSITTDVTASGVCDAFGVGMAMGEVGEITQIQGEAAAVRIAGDPAPWWISLCDLEPAEAAN